MRDYGEGYHFSMTRKYSNFSIYRPILFYFLLLASSVNFAGAAVNSPASTLKVCADPYMLPFSNKDQQGYENKIAELFASELDAKLQYKWFPQRMGFIRNTLKGENDDGSYKCDLVISTPAYFDLAATTQPYYTSVYMLVYAKGRGLDMVTSPEILPEIVKQGKTIKFGLFDRGPAQLWVFKHDLMESMVPYVSQPGGAKDNPGIDLLQDLVDGKVDVAIIWGPVAGYFAKKLQGDVELVLLPLQDDPEIAEMKFVYGVSMAVRYGEPSWRERVSKFIENNQAKINSILSDFGIPIVPAKKVHHVDDD